LEKGGLLTSPCSQASGLSFGLTACIICQDRHIRKGHLTTGSTARAAGSFGEITEESMIGIKQLRSTFPHAPPGGQPGR
jgi:hypothetical protein